MITVERGSRLRARELAGPVAVLAVVLLACGNTGPPDPAPGVGGSGSTILSGGDGGAGATDDSTGGEGGVFVPPGVVSHEGPLATGETWSRAWGGDGWCESQGVAFAPDGSIYVTGWFTRTTDFDPAAVIQADTAPENSGAFLSQFDPSGNLVRTWTWVSHDQTLSERWGNEGWAITVDDDGSVYLGGQYSGTLDFDPGPGIDEHFNVGAVDVAPSYLRFDAFIVKLTDGGDLDWWAVWDATEAGRAASLSLVDAGLVIGGQFAGTADMDPGPDAELRTATPPAQEGFTSGADCALVRLSKEGAFEWVHTWGDRYNESNCQGDASSDQIVISGGSILTSQLDYGSGVAQVGPGGWLVGFQTDGSYQWAAAFPSAVTDGAIVPGRGAVAGGDFGGTQDFGPTFGTRSAGDLRDASLFFVDEGGVLQWVRTWGGAGKARAIALDVTAEGIIAAGRFRGPVDFDTLSADVEQDAAFVRSFSFDGTPQWTHLVQGGSSFAADVAVQDGIVAVVGGFYDTADFDFGQGTDVWSSPGLYGCWLVRFAP